MSKFTLGWFFLAGLISSAQAQSEYEAYLQQNSLDMQAAQQEFKDYVVKSGARGSYMIYR